MEKSVVAILNISLVAYIAAPAERDEYRGRIKDARNVERSDLISRRCDMSVQLTLMVVDDQFLISRPPTARLGRHWRRLKLVSPLPVGGGHPRGACGTGASVNRELVITRPRLFPLP